MRICVDVSTLRICTHLSNVQQIQGYASSNCEQLWRQFMMAVLADRQVAQLLQLEVQDTLPIQ